MEKAQDFNEGDQIIFGENMEPGFVTSHTDKVVFCRFWSPTNLGSLRTLANSESCNPADLNKTGENVPDAIIQHWLEYIKED